MLVSYALSPFLRISCSPGLSLPTFTLPNKTKRGFYVYAKRQTGSQTTVITMAQSRLPVSLERPGDLVARHGYLTDCLSLACPGSDRLTLPGRPGESAASAALLSVWPSAGALVD